MERCGSELDLPGFRFHPTEEELLDYYLRRMVYGKKLNFDIIGTLNIYLHDPWELPKLAKIGEREWYFFVPRDRRQANGGRPNRTTERGFWKATGSDRPIRGSEDPKRVIGLKKTLVFYNGRAPRGRKTDWVMNEYRLPDSTPSTLSTKEDIVLCKVYRKATPLKELEQRAAMEEEARASYASTVMDSVPSDDQRTVQDSPSLNGRYEAEEVKEEEPIKGIAEVEVSPTAIRSVNHLEIQVPKIGLDWMQDPFLEIQVPKIGLDWMQDPFLTQLRSPWIDQWSPYYANILNF